MKYGAAIRPNTIPNDVAKLTELNNIQKIENTIDMKPNAEIFDTQLGVLYLGPKTKTSIVSAPLSSKRYESTHMSECNSSPQP
jgi:hypothetical protein